MVDILRKGVIPGFEKYEVTCQNCHTHFRFQKNEARYVSDQRDGDALVINCPVCSKEVWVNASLHLRQAGESF